MKLLNGKYKIRNRIMAAFLAVTMLLTLVPTGQMQVYAAGEGKVNVDSFTVKVNVNGEPLENVTEIKEGDQVSILCNWSLDDSDKTVDTYKVDLSSMLSNLKLVAGMPATVYDSELGAVGTVTIDENDVATYVFTNEEFLGRTNRTGSSTYDGVVTATSKKDSNGKDIPFGIGTAKKDVKYYADADVSELNVYKSRPSGAVLENGKLYQTFEVNLYADKGIVSGITLEDIAGSGLTSLSELKIKTVNGSDVGVTEGITYSNMADLNAALQGAVLAAGESITISYKMEVDDSIYTETSNMGKFGNIIKADYKDNRDNDKEKESNLVYADAKGPEMSKTATAYDETTGVITWKITIKLNDYLEDFKNSGKSIEDYITGIVETPGTGLNAAVQVGGITEEAEGIYSIVYTTSVTDDYKRRLENGSYTFSNTVSAKVGNKDVSASATKTAGADNWISKSFLSFDRTTRTLTWDVTLNIPNGVSNVELTDFVQETTKHVVQPSVSYNGAVIAKAQDDNGSLVIVDSSIVKTWESSWQGYKLGLTDDFVQRNEGQLVTFTFTTKIPDDFDWTKQTEFTNKVHLTYTDAVLGNQNQDAEATWKDENKQGVVITKKATPDGTKDSIAYEVRVDLSEIANLTTGETITLTDTLPDLMKFNDDATAKLVYVYQYYEDTNQGDVSITASDVADANARNFSFTVTDKMVAAVAAGSAASSWYKPTVVISYTASIADEKSFIMAGNTENITNSVTGKKGETSLGTATATAALTPKDVVSKESLYTADTAPDIQYTIDINPNALTLSSTGKLLTAQDALGTALTYNEDTIVLKEIDGSNEVTLTKGTDYTVLFTSDKKGMTLVVPDGKHLKLTYSAKLNLKTYTDSSKNESLTEENSKNTFSLFRFSSKQTKGETSYNQVAYTPKHQTVSETGSVTIKKFWTDNGTYTALAGSVFKIVRATYDADTGKMVDGALIKDNIEVGVDGTITVENLRKDWIYALYETKAKDGYARRTDPYYFIIDDDDSVTLPSGITIEKFVNDENVLEYENQLEAVLYITKTVENEDWDNVKNDITFTVKKGDLVIATVNGADMTENGGVYVATINQLEAGEYTVTETIAAGGKTPKTVTYKVGVKAAQTGQEATGIILLTDSYNTVAFTNTYEEKTGGLEITKTVTGDLNWEQVKNTISFKITDEDGTEITGSPVAGADFTETAPGSGIYHYVVSGLTVGKTYTVTEVLTGEDAAYTRTTTYTAQTNGTGETAVSAPISDTANSVVAFTNTYTAKTGEIEVTKKFGGTELPTDFESVTLTVENEAGTVVGTKTLAEIRSAAEAGTEGYSVTGSGTGAVYTWTLKDLPYGKYTVTETVTASAGYQCTAKYRINATAEKDYGGTAKPEVTVGAAAQKVSFTNTYTKLQGGLEIIKRVHGDLNWEQVKNTISFKITDEDGNEIPGSPVAGTALTETAPGSGIYHYVVSGLTVGKTYTVTEVLNGEDEAYARTTTYTAAASGTGETAVSAPISETANSVVAFTNTYTAKTGEIEVTKKFGGTELPTDFESVTLTVENEAGTVVGTKTLAEIRSAAKAGTEGYSVTGSGTGAVYTWTLKDLPYGKYTVTETVTASAGYQCTAKYQINATAEKDYDGTAKPEVTVGAATQKVSFTNTYTKLQGGLEITKTVTGDLNWEQVKNTISFKITDEDGNEITGSPAAGTALTETAPGSGIYHYVISGLTVGKTYTVTEVLNGEDEAYARTTTYTAAASGTGETAVSEPISNGANVVIAFTNTYTKKTGKIVITKTVLGNVDKAKAEAAISFKVTKTADGTSKTYKLSDFTYDTANKIWTLELEAAPGGYQVEETRNAIGGFTLKKVQYEVDASGKVDGSQASIQVNDGTSAKVAFENTYEKKTTTPSNPTTPPVTPTTPPSPQPPEPTPTDPGTPGTGDNSNLALWFILFAVSGMGLAALAISDKKNKKKQ